MSTAKAAALALIQKLPDDATWEKIAEVVSLRAQLELGEAEIAAGRGIPHDQVVKESAEWHKSYGPRPGLPSSEPITTGSPAIPS
jgi:hypothetical protein